MSADNWTTCPRCVERAKVRFDEAVAAVNIAYGQIPLHEFEARRAALPSAPEADYVFREDYEFYGAEEGVVKYHYSGQCRDCGLAVRFEGEYPFYPKAGL